MMAALVFYDLCGLMMKASPKQKCKEMKGTLYMAENNRIKGSLQRTDTEKPVCSVSGKSEYQGTTIHNRR